MQKCLFPPLFIALLCLSSTLATAAKPKVKVFILAGQSNMEGQGVVDLNYNDGKGNLETVLAKKENLPLYGHLRDKDGKWTERNDVWMRYRNKNHLLCGPLGIGYTCYGSPTSKHHFGPELEFGHQVGNYFQKLGKDQQVLLIKTAWGGKSLYQDFRPPSSGGTTGEFYKKMLAEVKEGLDNIAKEVPGYEGQGYEIVGFVWFQGWNDMCTKPAVPEYEANLVNLINDIRKEWKCPNLPVVIGELGNGGPKASGNMLKIREAQKAAAENPRAGKNVVFVSTSAFARPAEESPCTGHGHHWFANAESYFLIGKALGEGMVDLLKKAK